MKNYNISPYFDDFDEFKNYHQIMFKPGYAVQARELTQMQSILRNQIEKFGNHIFKHGSIVIPGNSFAQLGVDYITVGSSFNGIVLDNTRFSYKTIVGVTSGVEAKIIHIEDEASVSQPKTFYLSYTKSGIYSLGGNTLSTNTFLPDEEVYVKTDITQRALINDLTLVAEEPLPVGLGSLAFVNSGVYYINGSFVSTPKQTVTISRYTVSPSAHVLFRISETLVDYTDDETLLDPSQGSYNYTAPGADRVKIQIDLVSLPLNAQITDEYVELMRYNEGVLEEHARFPKYNELEKSFAKRTYEESGNYVVEGLKGYAQEYLRASNNNGKFTPATPEEAVDFEQKLVYNVTPGKAYIYGFGVETLVQKHVVVDKPRTNGVPERLTKRIAYGSYVLVNVTNASQLPAAGGTITFYDTASAGGNVVATAKFLTVDFYAGSSWGTRRIDKLYFYDFAYANGYSSLTTCARIVGTSSTFGALIHETSVDSTSNWAAISAVTPISGTEFSISGYDQSTNMLFVFKSGNTSGTYMPQAGQIITTTSPASSAKVLQIGCIFADGSDNLIQYLGRNGVKTLKDQNNLPDMDITTWERLTVNSGSSVSGTVSSGTIVGVDTGIFTVYSLAGLPVSISGFSVSGGGTQITAPDTAGYICFVQVRKQAAAAKTKTVQEVSGTPFTSTSTLGQRKITLPHYDVVYVQSVVIDGIERINDFKFERNTTQFAYLNSYVELRPGITSLPAGKSIAVKYVYLSHSGTSSFFSADSYVDIPNHFIETYTPANGSAISLRDCLDLRTGVNSSPVVSGSQIDTSVTYYLGRIDLVCVDKSGNIFVQEGNPGKTPRVPAVPEDSYVLDRYDLPPYLYSLDDISTYRLAVQTYTMEAISNIEERIDKLEEFATLSVAETQLLQTKVIDAKTGLEKYKTGYLVENVQDPFEIADVLATGYSASTSPQDGIYCRLENESINLQLYVPSTETSKIRVNNGGFVTLNYAESNFAKSQYSSKIVNVNPFNVVDFSGTMTLSPKQDYWVETLFLPEVTLRRSAWAWTTQPAAVPPVLAEPYNIPELPYTGVKYELPNKLGDAYYSGPSEISIDTIMGWDSRTRALSTWEYPNIQQYIRNGLNLR